MAPSQSCPTRDRHVLRTAVAAVAAVPATAALCVLMTTSPAVAGTLDPVDPPAAASTHADVLAASSVEEDGEGSGDGEAGADGEEAEGQGTAAQEIAESLAEDPLYTDSAFESVFSEQHAEELRSELTADERALFIIVVPLISGDDWGGDVQNMTSAVHSHMPDSALVEGAGHYLVSDGTRVTGLDHDPATSDNPESPAHNAALAASYRTEFQASVATEIATAVEIIREEDPRAAYDEAVENYDSPSSSFWYYFGPSPWIPVGAIAAVILLLGGFGTLFLMRRRATERRLELRTAPLRTKFANADAAQLDELSRVAAATLSDLGLRLAEAQARPDDPDATDALSAALEEHAAATKAHAMIGDGYADLADAAGTLVLLDHAAFDLDRAVSGPQRGKAGQRPQHCYANPLHGSQTTLCDWRPVGKPRGIRVPLCADCAVAVRRHSAPSALLVEHEGRDVPYYSVPAEDSVWSATGFGVLRSDLVERIMRGDLRRSPTDDGRI